MEAFDDGDHCVLTGIVCVGLIAGHFAAHGENAVVVPIEERVHSACISTLSLGDEFFVSDFDAAILEGGSSGVGTLPTSRCVQADVEQLPDDDFGELETKVVVLVWIAAVIRCAVISDPQEQLGADAGQLNPLPTVAVDDRRGR